MKGRNAVSDEVFISSNKKNQTVSDEHLTAIFAEVGRKYGYDDVTAEFCAFNDMKCRWQRSYRWIKFEVSDYLDRTPDHILRELAENIFIRISGGERDYSETFISYMNDNPGKEDNRRDFLKRYKLKDTSIGEFHDLNDSVNRLRDMNLIPKDLMCTLTWMDRGDNICMTSSVNMVASVNRMLDQKGVPEHVLDFAVYKALCPLILGFPHHLMDPETQDLIESYPMFRESQDWLWSHGMYS